MKMNYEAPNAEVISFTSMEQLASLNNNVELGDLGKGEVSIFSTREF